MANVLFENVSKSFSGANGKDVQAVSGLDLEIRDGEFMVLVGPSGCGKTTTLRMVAGLESIDTGSISMDGVQIDEWHPKDRDVAMVFQNYALYPHLNARENISLGLKLRKYPKKEIHQRLDEAASMLGIQDLLERMPDQLSGGQRQRVAVGRALVRRPKVFLFDEPLSNLDARMRLQMRMELTQLHQKIGATMIYVTHDQAEAMTMGDRIMVMDRGLLQQVARPVEVYQEPLNTFVAGFIGSPPMNLLCITWNQESHAWELGDQTLNPVPPLLDTPYARQQGSFKVGFRPECARLSEPASTAQTHPTPLKAQVAWLEPTGADTFVHLTMGKEKVVVRQPAAAAWQPGQVVALSIPQDALHCFEVAKGCRATVAG
jgi:multiple sugar transport system ATP-binding protein